MRRQEKENSLLYLLSGLYHTFDQWCRVLLPFTQWQMTPGPSLHDVLVLNSIGSVAALFGTFLVAYIVSLDHFTQN